MEKEKLLELTQRAGLAVEKLRERKLKAGNNFLLDSWGLLSDQVHYEYPNGSIAVVEAKAGNIGFTIIRLLTKEQNEAYRKYYNLPLLSFQIQS